MDLSRLKEITDIIQSLATVAAILAGGIWSYILFVRKRQRYPRAKITHQITHRPITRGKVFLNVVVDVSNTGETLLPLVSGETWVQQILPPVPDLLASIKKGHKLITEGETEVSWPLIDLSEFKWEKGQVEIEPGDSQQVRCDFILDAQVQMIKIYTFIRNVTKPGREIGWDLATFYNLKSS